MKFIGFDLETTGFLPGIDQIVEIGAVRYFGDQPEALFSTLINPGIPMPPAASKVNGITDEMLKGKPNIEFVLDSFAEFCEDSVIVAHNASFDFHFLVADIKKYESKAPRGVVLDTLGMAKKIFPGLANYKLGTLVDYLKINATEFHRAEVDASYCGQLFYQMIKKVASVPGCLPPEENLIALTGKPKLTFPQLERQPKQLSLLDL